MQKNGASRRSKPHPTRLAKRTDNIVTFDYFLSQEQIDQRSTDYHDESPKNLRKASRERAFVPVLLNYGGKGHEIQVNRCTNPLCKWFGQDQMYYEIERSRKGQHTNKQRYDLTGTGGMEQTNTRLACLEDERRCPSGGVVITSGTTDTLSNWSLAEEIARLAAQDCVVRQEPEYQFHHDDCPNRHLAPSSNPEGFYRKGKSTSNSQKWQCKTCGKNTNTMPSRRDCFTYNQKRNDIVIALAKHLVNKSAIRRTMELLEIGAPTYYSKLDWLYQRCLEFLERHEKQAFAQHGPFETMWVNTDVLVYRLKNVRKRGLDEDDWVRYSDDYEEDKNGNDPDDPNDEEISDPFLQTRIIVSADVKTRYVFRADVAYDSEARSHQIKQDTVELKEDGLHNFARKNARFGIFSALPPLPKKASEKARKRHRQLVNGIAIRDRYVDGLHVVPTYTTFASLFLLKQMVQAKEWRFVTDNDSSLLSALYRAFAMEISHGNALHFLSLVERKQKKGKAFSNYMRNRRELKKWALLNGYDYHRSRLDTVAFARLVEYLGKHDIYQFKTIGGRTYPVDYRTIEHPLPGRDEGVRLVACTTDISTYGAHEQAELFLSVNNRATDAFFSMTHRRLSVLERPQVAARARGKTYLYNNVRPDVAQKMVTILRVWRNFIKVSGGDKMTPAQRIGIADRAFTWRDIVYFR